MPCSGGVMLAQVVTNVYRLCTMCRTQVLAVLSCAILGVLHFYMHKG